MNEKERLLTTKKNNTQTVSCDGQPRCGGSQDHEEDQGGQREHGEAPQLRVNGDEKREEEEE